MVSNFELAKAVIKENDGIATTLQLKNAGLQNYEIGNLFKSNLISRIRQGFYCLPDELISDEQLLSTVLPEGIVCLESALFHYGYSDYPPSSWAIAVPRTISQSKLKIPGLSIIPHYVPASNYNLGLTSSDFNGYTLMIYDKERTICDCFKYRNQMDSETFAKAINAYSVDSDKNLINLSKYAKQLRVYKKVMEMMEVLLNG